MYKFSEIWKCIKCLSIFFQLTGEQKELFATGRSQEPLITRMEGGEQLALAHDKETIFVDAEGNATRNYTIKWDEQPLTVGETPRPSVVFCSLSFCVRN